jgi:hypothetical protein
MPMREVPASCHATWLAGRVQGAVQSRVIDHPGLDRRNQLRARRTGQPSQDISVLGYLGKPSHPRMPDCQLLHLFGIVPEGHYGISFAVHRCPCPRHCHRTTGTGRLPLAQTLPKLLRRQPLVEQGDHCLHLLTISRPCLNGVLHRLPAVGPDSFDSIAAEAKECLLGGFVSSGRNGGRGTRGSFDVLAALVALGNQEALQRCSVAARPAGRRCSAMPALQSLQRCNDQ